MPPAKTTNENYVTMPVFERSMRAIATSFSDLDERLDKRFEAVDRRFDSTDRKLDDIVLEMKRMNANIEEHQLAIKLFIKRDMRREM